MTGGAGGFNMNDNMPCPESERGMISQDECVCPGGEGKKGKAPWTAKLQALVRWHVGDFGPRGVWSLWLWSTLAQSKCD